MIDKSQQRLNSITRGTPVGTRVLVAWKHGDTFGGPRLDRTVTTSEPFTQNGVVWPTLVRLACDDQPFRIAQVYHDQPAPGTWQWACEQALTGTTAERVSGRERFQIYNNDDNLAFRMWDFDQWIEAVPTLEEVTATNWEIAP
jgi:hypothetical protein